MAIERELEAACARRHALGLPSAQTNAYRLLHGEGDGVPELTVDVYDRYLVASLYSEALGAREEGWLRDLAALDYEGVYVKLRPKQASRMRESERKERAPEHAALGRDAPFELEVRENGVPFVVRLGDGLSTGLFLDQRDNRARFAALSAHKRVLNLFAYTCAFGVCAARAGACATINVDVAKAALERGRQNYALSGVGGEAHAFWARDVLELLPRLARRGERFELVALDPPSFASTGGKRFSVERDYERLVGLSLALLAPGGNLLACTNHARLSEREVQRTVGEAARSVGVRTTRVELVPPPLDHPPTPGRPAHLKSAWITV